MLLLQYDVGIFLIGLVEFYYQNQREWATYTHFSKP